jgi:Ca-activated chloride channel family protein
MKWIQYSRFTGEDFGIGAEDLMRALADFFLQSGFERQSMYFHEMDANSLERLREAIEKALRDGSLFEERMRQQMQQQLEQMSPEDLQGLVDRLMQKLEQEGYVNTGDQRGPGDKDNPKQTRFDITDKSVDFLGFKTLKDLLAGLGRASFGAHDTRELATGVEASGSSKQYEFGDTLNIDIGETLFSALKREGLGLPLNLEYPDRVSKLVRDRSAA